MTFEVSRIPSTLSNGAVLLPEWGKNVIARVCDGGFRIIPAKK